MAEKTLWPVMHLMTVPGVDARRDSLVEEWLTSDMYPGKVCLHADPERRGVLWNHAGIVECALKGDQGASDWAMIMQDDIKPVEGWLEALEQVMEHAPGPFVSLGHLYNYGTRLVERGIPFGTGINAIWGQAVLYNFDVLPEYSELVQVLQETNPEKYRNWDDYIPIIFNLIYGTEAAFTSRALVEHQNWESTLGHLSKIWRRAETTIASAGPAWDSLPRAKRGSTPGVEKRHREATAMVLGYWEQEKGQEGPPRLAKGSRWVL